MKIRINELARELEVPNKVVLDALAKVGVTEKKTHSSSVEADEAVRLRQYIRGQSGGAEAKPKPEIKPKIDLSKLTRPGDAAKAIRQAAEEPAPSSRAASPASAKSGTVAPVKTAAKPAAPEAPKSPLTAKPTAPARTITPQEVASRPTYSVPGAAVPKEVAPGARVDSPSETEAKAAKKRSEAAGEAPSAAKPSALAEAKAESSAAAIAESAGGVAAPEAVSRTDSAGSGEDTGEHAGERAAKPRAPGEAATPAHTAGTPASRSTQTAGEVAKPVVPAGPPPRRIITPQTGPRPVYAAPPPSAVSTTPARPAGVPVRGQPIFQRPRPGMPGSRPGGPGGSAGFGAPGARPGGAFQPGQRRPMHPTRTGPGGAPGAARPFGVGPGLPPPGAPARPGGQRPGGPARRPGQPYKKHQEGPMKGFQPPPRVNSTNEPLPITREITLTEGITLKDLAEKLDVRAKELIARLMVRGVLATVNQNLDIELAKELARHFGAESNVISFEEQVERDIVEEMGPTVEDTSGEASQRPPVVTIMGHVDHGKTSLLDAIRETDVAGGEAGGITQHIGAYKVRIGKKDSPAFGREITFLDTPGHEAFTRMRARGAKVTDIVVVVVAADDGVMPQTIEAIDHAQAAKVPIIVAVNKVDKPEAQPDRVKKQLADRGLLPEDWGGTTVFVDVSAKAKTNLDLLLEMICLVADIQGLKGQKDRPASGSVVEAKLDRGRGAVATILVQNGTLRTGDMFVVGNSFGKVRAMFDDRGKTVDEAGPSTPVEVLGLEGMPTAGDQFTAVTDRDKAKTISEFREMRAREAALSKSSRVSLEGLAEQIKNAGMKELPIILKGDVAGSVEVLADSLAKLSTEKVKIKILHTGVGAITETDVLLASASNAIIIGFNVRPERKAQEIAEQEQVDIRLHSIIYELQDEIRRAMVGLLDPVFKETYQGRAEVRDTFRVPKVGTIAGCLVQDGSIRRDSEVRLLRDDVQVFKGKVSSLKRFKDDASEVRNGMECGIGLANFNDVKVGDVIEAFTITKVAPELEPAVSASR